MRNWNKIWILFCALFASAFLLSMHTTVEAAWSYVKI